MGRGSLVALTVGSLFVFVLGAQPPDGGFLIISAVCSVHGRGSGGCRVGGAPPGLGQALCVQVSETAPPLYKGGAQPAPPGLLIF